MINLFRKLRALYIDKEEYKKYLFYITGEIFLVVIGILIALQINNWNEGRKRHDEKIKMLIELKNEFEENQKVLENRIGLHSFISSETDKLVKLFAPRPQENDVDRIDTLLITMAFIPEFKATTAVLYSENTVLIRDSNLKSKIADWRFRYEEYRQNIQLTYDLYNDHIYPFLSRHYQIKNAGGIFFESEKSLFQVDMNKILSNSTFENHVVMRNLQVKTILSNAITLNDLQIEIIKDIDRLLITER